MFDKLRMAVGFLGFLAVAVDHGLKGNSLLCAAYSGVFVLFAFGLIDEFRDEED
jgi:hypothetical protein